jgi:hypothetical protein
MARYPRPARTGRPIIFSGIDMSATRRAALAIIGTKSKTDEQDGHAGSLVLRGRNFPVERELLGWRYAFEACSQAHRPRGGPIPQKRSKN